MREDFDRTWPAGWPATVYGAALNTRSQLAALGDAMGRPPYGAPPAAPVLYIKPPNTVSPGGGIVCVPAALDALEIGATLALVIGRTACRVSEAEALAHVAGYAVAIDLAEPHGSLHRPPVRQRCRDGFLPLGPLAPKRETLSSGDLEVVASINGEDVLRWSTSELIRPAAKLISDVTEFMTLAAGDVLMVGLPAEAPLARRGDRAAARIERLGEVDCTLIGEAGA